MSFIDTTHLCTVIDNHYDFLVEACNKNQLWPLLTQPAALLNSYFLADPLISAIYICLFVSFACWFLSIITREHSWVDRIWSITPFVYCWHFAYFSEFSPRVVIIACLTTIWGCRLTFNFWRKGGYQQGGEDYRWGYLKARLHFIVFEIFNITFIALFQNVLLLAISLPAYVSLLQKNTPLNVLDIIATLITLSLIVLETVADEQQWQFHLRKYKQRYPSKYQNGFLSQGLFQYSRHPNFFAEMSIWWGVYLFSVASSKSFTLVNFSIIGAVVLTLLFQGSTNLTESISVSKYPAYAEYQKTTSRLIPWFPKTTKTSTSTKKTSSTGRTKRTKQL